MDTDHIDLTAHCPDLRSSLTPAAAEFSGVTSTLASRKAAEEFQASAIGLMAAWLLGFVALLSVCLLLWGRQPEPSFTPVKPQQHTTEP